MEWSRRFPQNVQPNLEQIAAFAGTPLWAELCTWLETEWNVRPLVQYSSCSGAKGWNVKYRKGGRALCTLYPGLPGGGSFTCLVRGPKAGHGGRSLPGGDMPVTFRRHTGRRLF